MKATVTLQDIPFNKLILADTNIRKTPPEPDAPEDTVEHAAPLAQPLDPSLPRNIRALAVNILAYGLLQPLGVYPHDTKPGFFKVHFGGRRYRALSALVKARHLKASAPVSCRVGESAAALAEALSENIMREAMHPLDECEAFRSLLQEGQTLEDIAARFSISVRTVQQRLRLAGLHPEIVQAYRERKLRLEQVQALACTADQDVQFQAYQRGLQASWQASPQEIRRFLLSRGVNSQHRLARYVGREAYLAAGGVIEETLFDDADLWQDTALLENLAIEKLQADAAAHMSAGEYGEVRTVLHSSHGPTWQDLEGLQRLRAQTFDLSEENAVVLSELEAKQEALQQQDELTDDEGEELERIEKAIEALENKKFGYTPEVKAEAIAFLYVDGQGQVQIDDDLYAKIQAVTRRNPASDLEDDLGSGEDAGETGAEEPFAMPASRQAPAGKPLPSTLLADLAVQRSQILAVNLSGAPDLAYDTLVFMLASKLLASTTSTFLYEFGFDLRVDRGVPREARPETLPALDPENALSPQATAWLDSDDLAERFLAFRTLSAAQKADLLAVCVALMCQPSLNSAAVRSSNFRYGLHELLGALLDIDIRDAWAPTALGYWSRLTKEQCLEALEAVGAGSVRHAYAGQKKHALAESLERLFRGEGHVGEEINTRARAWAPPLLTFSPLPHAGADKADEQPGQDEPEVGPDEPPAQSEPDVDAAADGPDKTASLEKAA